jgi:hypothetical protein
VIAATTLRGRLAARRHTALLVAIVIFFVLRALVGSSGSTRILFSLALLVVLVVALYTVEVDELVGERTALLVQRRRWRALALALGVVAVVERAVMVAHPTPALELAGAIGWLAFFVFVTGTQLHSTLRQRTITGETISMAMSVYLLLGITWAMLFALIHELQPGAFAFSAAADRTVSAENAYPVFIYFSLTTLSTVGYGDITPVSMQARFAAVAEGIVGQLFLAILVARLVGMHMVGLQAKRSDDR